MSETTDRIAEATKRLTTAYREKAPCAPVRDLIGHDDTVAAYAVQSRIEAAEVAAGRIVVGRKIGLTSLAVQAQLGVDQPDFGSLYSDTGYESGSEIAANHFLQPRIEAEVAVAFSRDIDNSSPSLDELLDALDWVAPALEIVDSRIADWDISLSDTIADNASYGGHVIGPRLSNAKALDFTALAMEMDCDGEVASTGSGKDCMGSPLIAAAWLARTLHELGQPIRAGQVILTGALGKMLPVEAKQHYVARIEGLGKVSCDFN